MLVPILLSLVDVMAESGYTEEQVLDLGISGNVTFLVVVPEVGACRVPDVALSHFMAGAGEYTADKMPEHWSGALSGQWTITRDRLRILPKSWHDWTGIGGMLVPRVVPHGTLPEAERIRAVAPTIYFFPSHARLEPRTAWRGGRLADTDLLTLGEASTMASKHAGTEVTMGDFLRAAGRGEILLCALCPRTVTMQPCIRTESALHIPERSIPTLPLVACRALSNTGQASWRTLDGFEEANAGAFEATLCRYTRWQLAPHEPDLVTTPESCRVSGHDVHALADAFASQEAETTAESVSGSAATDSLTSIYAAQKAHRLAANCFEIFEAAEGIAKQQGLSKYDEEKLRDDMAQAAFDEKLTVRSPRGHDQYAPTTPPDTTYSYYYLTTPHDVNKWAKSRGFTWTWEVPSIEPQATPLADESASAEPSPELPHWKMQVQSAAAEHWKTLRASGANPTVNSIVDWMAKWCKDHDVLTDSGINPSSGYLRTHVLGGGHWNPPT